MNVSISEREGYTTRPLHAYPPGVKFYRGRSTKLTHPENCCRFKQATLVEIFHQCGPTSVQVAG